MIKYKRLVKWTLFGLTLILVFILIVGFIWWNYPYKQIDLSQLTDPSALIQIVIPSPSRTLTREFLIHQIENKYLSQIPIGFKRRLATRGLSIIYPQETRVLVLSNSTNEDYLFIVGVDFGRSMKILGNGKYKIESQIFKGVSVSKSNINGYIFVQRTVPVTSEKTMNALVWIDSGLLLCTDIDYLKKLVRQYNPNTISTTTLPEVIKISINNESSFLTDKVKTYEQKFQFDIFPTINQVKSIDIQLVPKDNNKVIGTFVFHGKNELTDDDLLVSDVNLFYSLVQGALRPKGIELNGEQSHSGKDVQLKLEFSDINSMISQLESLSQGM